MHLKYLLILFLFMPTIALSKEIRGVNINFVSPENTEELCKNEFEIWQYFSVSTEPNSVLLTCFMNKKEWAPNSDTTIYKIEIMKSFIELEISEDGYPDLVNTMMTMLDEVNKNIEAHKGGMTQEERKSLARLKLLNSDEDDVRIKKTIWKHLKSGKNFEIYGSTKQMVSKLHGEKVFNDMMAFINIKGKILTLRAENSKPLRNSFDTLYSRFLDWIIALNKANKL